MDIQMHFSLIMKTFFFACFNLFLQHLVTKCNLLKFPSSPCFSQKSTPSQKFKPLPYIAAAFDMRDENGTLLFTVTACEEKR